jgi:hypothetical protein
MTRLGRFSIVLALSASLTGWAGAAETGPVATDSPVTADIYEFVAKIGPDLGSFKLNGDQNYERGVTFARNANHELVVTSLAVLRPGQAPEPSVGMIGVVLGHYPGQCELPYGSDDTYTAAGGLIGFVTNGSGKVWEMGRADGIVWIRQVNSPASFGPWEKYQTDPAKYETYHCGA